MARKRPRPARFTTKEASIAYYTKYAHGTIARYALGYCRCAACVEGGRQYRAAGRRLTSTSRVLRKLRELRRQGVGRRAVAEAIGSNARHLQRIINGRARVSIALEQKILAVTAAARFDCGIMPANNARRWLGRLLDEGYNVAQLADMAGLDPGTVRHMLDGHSARACSIDKVQAVYDETFKTLGAARVEIAASRVKREERVRLTPERGQTAAGGVHPWRLDDRAGFLRWQSTRSAGGRP